MKTLMITAAAVVLLGAPAAFAQQGGGQGNEHHGGEGRGQPQGHAPPQGHAGGPPQGVQGGRPGGQWQGGQGGHPGGAPRSQFEPGARPGGQWQGGAPREQGRAGPVQPGAGRAPFQGQGSGEWREGRWQGRGDRGQVEGRAEPGRGGQWQPRGDRDRWQEFRREPRFHDYQRNVFAQRRFRLGAYDWPRGWGYRRWTFGEFLPPVFFAQDYWIDDYGDYGLPYAPPGTVWVRYGPDALLIDQYTGEIIQVVYGLFY